MDVQLTGGIYQEYIRTEEQEEQSKEGGKGRKTTKKVEKESEGEETQ